MSKADTTMPPATSNDACRKCGSPLERFAPGRVCARCLLEVGLSDSALDGVTGEGREPAAVRSIPNLGRFGRYELLEEIGRGGMGVVYRARDLKLNRVVALKMILAGQFASERELKRFRAEAEAVARLDHPNIVPIYEVGEQDGRPFFSMKFMEGGTLTERLVTRAAPLDPHQAVSLLVKVARAVHHAHQRAILHRDLKPGNILLDAQGEPHVSDFGLAKCLDSAEGLTLSGAMMGSPSYMSPEQASGDSERLTTASDTYSLGGLMYQWLTGRPPFEAATPLATMEKVQRQEPLPPRALRPDTDLDLETICLKCLEKDPQLRYASAHALAEELERWLRGEPIRARPSTVAERCGKWMRRNPRVAALAILLNTVFLVALGVGIWMSYRIAMTKNEAEKANLRLAKELRNLQWQKLEELASAGKRPDALAYLSRFLRDNPNDDVAASRVLSMLSQRNFILPVTQPLKHDGPVNSAAFSVDGSRILTASNDGTVKVWDAQNGRILARFAHAAPVRRAEFVGNTHQVMSLCDDGQVRVWGGDGNERFATKLNNVTPEAVRLSPNGKWFAAATDASTIRILDASNGQPSGRRIPLENPRPLLQFSLDSKRLAVRSRPREAELWEVPTGERAVGPIDAGGAIIVLAFNPNGQQLFIGCDGGRGVVFDARTGSLIKELPSHLNDILAAEFSPDGETLAVIGFSQPIHVWSARTWELVGPPFDAASMHVGFRIAPESKRIVTFFQHGGARLRDMLSGQMMAEPFEHDGPIVDVSFSPDGGKLVSASQDGTARQWTTRMRKPQGITLASSQVDRWDAQLSPDGAFVSATLGHSALLLDAHSGQPVGQPMVHRSYVYTARFSPDGKRVATGSHDATARIWSVPGGEPITPELNHEQRVMELTFSPDSQQLLTTSDDRTAKLWNATDGRLLFSLPHDSVLTDAAFSRDGEKILTATAQGTVSLWAARTGTLLRALRHEGAVWTVCFDRAGARVLTASSDKTVRIWNSSTGQILQTFRHPQAMLGAVFSPDEKTILTSSLDGMARLWDASTGEIVAEPMRHAARVRSAQFSPDGRRVVTASDDYTSRVWDAGTGYPVSEPEEHNWPVVTAHFTADGQQVFSASGIIRISENPKPPPAAPVWFCDFIEALAGRRFNARGDMEPVSHEKFEALRDKLSTSAATDFYSRWAHWFFVERSNEPVPAFNPHPAGQTARP